MGANQSSCSRPSAKMETGISISPRRSSLDMRSLSKTCSWNNGDRDDQMIVLRIQVTGGGELQKYFT